jgi:hydrogenase-4 component F
MTIPLLILGPLVAAVGAIVLRSNTLRRGLLISVAGGHGVLTATAWVAPPAACLGGRLAIDAPGLLILSIVSGLFLAAALYAIGYLRREKLGRQVDVEEGFLFSNAPEAVFTGCLLFFLATMSFVTVCHHFGFLWVAIESTTLASAPLIYFHRHHRSLEATWKYLLICSVGIALALLGNFFLAVAATPAGGGDSIPLVLEELLAHASSFNVPWLKGAFIFLLVGYGTKMGLAPLHTWLPDAHSESPSVVSALLSGALLNCAFLGILRMQQVSHAAGQGAFGQELLVVFGLISMAVAAIFIIQQSDYKRMLAYSSVEHMGILALGIGLGGAATFGAFLHAVNHSLAKGMLFFVSGNILAVYRTKSALQVRGVIRVLPISGWLWILGFLAIAGSPPFGPFLSEFTILKSALDQGHYGVAGLYLLFLQVIFVGMAATVLRMAQGTPLGGWEAPAHIEPTLAVFSPAVLGILVITLGLYIPTTLERVLHEAAVLLGGF